jgi:DNA polymerase-1
VRRVPEVRSVHPRIRSAGLRQAGNMPIQGYAAGVFKLGAARVEKLFEELRAGGIWVEALLPVHDEIVAECDSSWAELVNDLMGQAMESALTDIETGEVHCRVPVKTDGKVMSRWTKE